MKSKSLVVILLVIGILIVLFYTFRNGTSDDGYRGEIKKKREETDHYMRTSDASPFVLNKIEYQGLSYFPVDERYTIIADLKPSEEKKIIEMPTSDGKVQRFVNYGYAEFDLGNRHHRLLILESMDMGPSRGKLFLGFGDETNAEETYGGGRYLDVKKVPGSSTITLDFNLAYNPYCAYTNNYSCPLPPPENVLDIPIRAGEKNYHPN